MVDADFYDALRILIRIADIATKMHFTGLNVDLAQNSAMAADVHGLGHLLVVNVLAMITSMLEPFAPMEAGQMRCLLPSGPDPLFQFKLVILDGEIPDFTYRFFQCRPHEKPARFKWCPCL
jgi:hypothetical protein